MKKYFSKLVATTLFSFIFLTTLAEAQATPSTLGMSLPDFKDVGGVITNFNHNILQNLVLALSGAAVVVFFFGLVQFIIHRAQGNDSSLKKDKDGMLWGLGALFVLVSVWGIIKFVQSTLGVNGSEDIHIPKICFTDNCADSSTASTASPSVGSSNNSSATTLCATGNVYSTSTGKCIAAADTKLNTNFNSAYTTDTIMAWSNLPMTSGRTGDDVAQLQNFLKSNGFSNLEINGTFDLATTNALKAYQASMKLVSDGELGPSTKAVILYRTLGAVPDSSYTFVKNWTRDLSLGSQGEDVKELQSLLKQFGCYASGSSSDSDGIFGNDTENALATYQAKTSLTEDKIVGPSTRAVLMATFTGDCVN